MAAADNCIVIDYGTETIKAGLASSFPTEDCPPHVIPSAVQVGPSSGHAATTTPLEYNCPVQRGQITDFDQFEALLHHIIYDLVGWTYEAEGNVVICEPLMTPKADREQLTQLMFEQFNVDGLFVHDSAVLSLYAVGKYSGLVVDVGHGKIDIAAIFDGATNTAATRRFPFAGQDITRHLLQLLQRKGLSLHDARNLRHLKHQCCKAAESTTDYEQLTSSAPPQSYILPDGQQIPITSEGYDVVETLFTPKLLQHDSPGIADLATECVQQYYDGMGRKSVFENILVCGGGSSIPNLQSRFLREVKLSAHLGAQPAVCGIAEYLPSQTQRYAAWSGGAVMARVVQQQGQMMSKGDYEEAGPSCVHRKCA